MNDNDSHGGDQKLIRIEDLKRQLNAFIEKVIDLITNSSKETRETFHTLARVARLAITKVEKALDNEGDVKKEVENFNAHLATLRKFTADSMDQIVEKMKYPLSEKSGIFIRHLFNALQYINTKSADSYRNVVTLLIVEIEKAYVDDDTSKLSDLKTKLGLTIAQIVQTFRNEIRDFTGQRT